MQGGWRGSGARALGPARVAQSARSRGGGDARRAGGRGRGRAPPAASPCPSRQGGCIAERRGSAPPWCSSDSCTNPENRIKRKGKAASSLLPSVLSRSKSQFSLGWTFPTGVRLRVDWKKSFLSRRGRGERVGRLALDTGWP
jgi:hypothetical protein